MSSSPACVDKYMCVRVCPLRIDHNAQLARRERPECVSVVRSGAPSLSTFSTIQVLSAFSSSCPPLFLTSPSSLLVTFWHVHPSVCLVCPDAGPSQVSPNANIQTHADGNLGKKKKRGGKKAREGFLELQRHMHLENVETHTFWTNLNTKMQIFSLGLRSQVVRLQPAQFTHSQTSAVHPLDWTCLSCEC